MTPEGLDTRPTTDKVKEAVCSSLQFDFPEQLCWICLPEADKWASRH